MQTDPITIKRGRQLTQEGESGHKAFVLQAGWACSFKLLPSGSSAIERTAHFFMELAERLTLVGLATETEFECPLSQFVLADALGLTSIHVNRVLRQLRELNLLTLRKKSVMIHDLAGLRKLAGYRGGYLNARA